MGGNLTKGGRCDSTEVESARMLPSSVSDSSGGGRIEEQQEMVFCEGLSPVRLQQRKTLTAAPATAPAHPTWAP